MFENSRRYLQKNLATKEQKQNKVAHLWESLAAHNAAQYGAKPPQQRKNGQIKAGKQRRVQHVAHYGGKSPL